MNFPENILYTEDHEWIRFENDFACVGITDFAQKELGDIVFVEIESVGNSLIQNEVFGTIEAVKTVSDLFLPVSGKILEINSKINSSPDLVNTDPYGEGWIIKIQPDEQNHIEKLLSINEYKRLIGVNS